MMSNITRPIHISFTASVFENRLDGSFRVEAWLPLYLAKSNDDCQEIDQLCYIVVIRRVGLGL